MSEWWTYRLSDLLLFSPQTYYRLFGLYNAAIWPAQLVALAVGLAILALLIWRPSFAGRAIALLLAACWVWVAWGYLATRYATINWAATYFAWGFAAEAFLLLVVGLAAGKLTFAKLNNEPGKAGFALFVAGVLIVPFIGLLAGRDWLQAELFGIAPDPTVVATLGLLVAADRMRWELIALPFLWCFVSGATLWSMQVPDAVVMPASAILALSVAAYRAWQQGRRA